MKYLALATDYDGTIAHDGVVDGATLAALHRVRDSGRKLVLVSGRELEDFFATFAHADLFDRLVLENGALLYEPAAGAVGEQSHQRFPGAVFKPVTSTVGCSRHDGP